MTWYGQNGFYADVQGRLSWFSSDLASAILGNLASGNDGFGYGLSLEADQRFATGDNWALAPGAVELRLGRFRQLHRSVCRPCLAR
nr:autotransporter outer membrane beta-barrel domain-containing protein [Sinorhizobium medicae]